MKKKEKCENTKGNYDVKSSLTVLKLMEKIAGRENIKTHVTG